ncbi:hypothetical protein OGZ02_16435 [Brachyspira hyodysenteriae]|nr:hypothetical protein [Brachyspira hyodysenteriae]MDA1470348.1 hypothetical protein [Brachyspira hyodysenteriae]
MNCTGAIIAVIHLPLLSLYIASDKVGFLTGSYLLHKSGYKSDTFLPTSALLPSELFIIVPLISVKDRLLA